MLPPDLSFNAVSKKAMQASKTARLQRSYWDWLIWWDQTKREIFPTRRRPICFTG
jgi:alanine-glyoxylate transaminase/serine-glyoxylate transaminase/serine-pyruvate transaminase